MITPQSPQPSLADLVRDAHRDGYSDLHLGVGRAPHARDRGAIVVTPHPTTDEATFYGWLAEILPPEDIESFRRTWDYDGAADYRFVRVRINLLMTLKGPSMVLRLISTAVPTLKALKFPPIFYEICQYPQGLVLITGPTGSGKSTTLAAMVNEINETLPRHIITIEDPIEFVHLKDIKSVISQREIGIHTQDFPVALKACLREDPDVILIGEIRDKETLRIALKASQTGHLVFGTLHTNSAVKSLERIFNLFEPNERDTLRIEVAESLAAIVSQALVRTTDNRRVALYEILINNDTVRDYIKRDDPDEIEEQMKRGDYYGMCTRNQTIRKFVEDGSLSIETALEASLKPQELAISLKGCGT
jgi:twitching motility protein PilT